MFARVRSAFSLILISFFALAFIGANGLPAAPAAPAVNAPVDVSSAGVVDDALAANLRAQGFMVYPLKRGIGPHLEAMAEINGVPGQFLVDTGAQISVINRPSIARFKLTEVKTAVRVYGAVGGPGEQIGAALANRIKLGPCTASPFLLGVSNLTSLSQGRNTGKAKDGRFDGILGSDVLQNFAFVIDFEGARLFGKQPESTGAPTPKASALGGFLKGRGYSEIPMQRRSISDFEVIANVNGRKALWLVDTGAAITLLDSVLSRQAGIKLSKTNLSVGGAGGGKQRIDIGIVDNLRLNSLRVRSAVIAVSDISANNAALQEEGKPPIDGYLGADFLRQKGAIIDCGQMRLYLKN
jgi:predicted aspartyl protease